MIVEHAGKIFHDEHDIEISISNDNTKHVKVVKIKLRSDADPKDALKLAKELYMDGLKDE